MKIKCERCGRVVKVSGYVWRHRLSFNPNQDEDGNYLGWHCDRCAEAIESGIDSNY
jgi:hypothetical protein